MNDIDEPADPTATIASDPASAPLFITAPKHLEQLLSEELSSLVPEAEVRGSGGGAAVIPPAGRASWCAGRIELWSRIAGRVLIEIARGRTADRESLYRLAHALPWEVHMSENTTFAIGGHTSHRAFRNPNIPRLVIKDALCDRFVELRGSRPSVDTDEPDLRLYAFVTDRETIIYVDASGGSLHRRGYRSDTVEAPLRENTAAGVLARSGWTAAVDRWRSGDGGPRKPGVTRQGDAGGAPLSQEHAGEPPLPQEHGIEPPLLVDPMCGSGTIAIEAAMIACDVAPGILREQSGLSAWRCFDAEAWEQLREEATRRAGEGLARWREAAGRILASDIDSTALEAAKANAGRAGVADAIAFECSHFAGLNRADIVGDSAGSTLQRECFLVTNPPYGVRIHGRSATTEQAGGQDGGGRSAARRQGPDSSRHSGNQRRAQDGDKGSAAGRQGQNRGGSRPGDNPPDAEVMYAELGRWLSNTLSGFHATVLAEHAEQARALGLQARKLNRFYNGAMEIVGARIDVGPENRYQPPKQHRDRQPGTHHGGVTRSADTDPDPRREPKAFPVSRENVGMVANRLRKNRRLLKKYLAREHVSCFRLYDADIPQYAAAVDIYTDADGQQSVVLQEYAAPKEIEAETAATRLAELITAVAEVLELPPDSVAGEEEATGSTRINIKRRERQRGKHQYRRSENPVSVVRTVYENGLAFEVNFTDYLDTGLFCDQRITRQRVRDLAKGRRMLNLFAYTCSVSVAAAAGGAMHTTSVDTSKHYLEWGRRNFALNGLSAEHHRFICDDAFAYLWKSEAIFDLIYIDPPAFSNSKDRQDDFDVQRDHTSLIETAAEHLTDNGTIVFANNLRGFRLDGELSRRFEITDWSSETLPSDFQRQAKRHHVFRLQPKEG